MTEQRAVGQERLDLAIRFRGGLAALAPSAILMTLFVASDPSTSLLVQLPRLAPVATIAIVAGVIAAPVAAGPRRRLVAGALAFAVVQLAVLITLSVAQGVGDAISTVGFDPISILGAAVARAGVGLVSALYLLVPFVGLGVAWSLVAHALNRVGRIAIA